MTTLLFHTQCGNKAEVTNGQKTALRQNANDDFKDGVVFTNRTLKNNEHFEVKLDETVDCWTGSLQIGITTHDPTNLTFPATITDLKSGTWVLTSDGMNKDGEITDQDFGENLDDIKKGDRVGVIKKDKTLHFTINGIDQGQAATDIPANVYGVVDIFAQAAKVTIVN